VPIRGIRVCPCPRNTEGLRGSCDVTSCIMLASIFGLLVSVESDYAAREPMRHVTKISYIAVARLWASAPPAPEKKGPELKSDSGPPTTMNPAPPAKPNRKRRTEPSAETERGRTARRALPRGEDLTQRRKEPQRVAERSFPLRPSRLCGLIRLSSSASLNPGTLRRLDAVELLLVRRARVRVVRGGRSAHAEGAAALRRSARQRQPDSCWRKFALAAPLVLAVARALTYCGFGMVAGGT